MTDDTQLAELVMAEVDALVASHLPEYDDPAHRRALSLAFLIGRKNGLLEGQAGAKLMEDKDRIAALQARAEAAERDRALYKRQLDAVDAHLGPWESERVPGAAAVGRVQTILNLREDRARAALAGREETGG